MNDVHPRSKLFTPKSLSEQSRRRLERARRALYLSRITGEPSDRQLQTIDSLIFLEWAAYVAQREGGLTGLREAREHRRLYERLLSDFERSLVRKPKSAAEQRADMAAFNLSRIAAAQAETAK